MELGELAVEPHEPAVVVAVAAVGAQQCEALRRRGIPEVASPPSPQVAIFVGLNENTDASPNAPAWRSPYQLANACAASKTSCAPVVAASASSPATSQAAMNACVPTIAAVRA